MKHLKKLFSSALMLMILACGFLVGCNEAKIELSVENKIYEVKAGSTLQITADCVNINKTDLQYECEGPAIIDNTGLLTVNQSKDIVGNVIKVSAKAGKVESNVINITVVDLEPTAIDLTASNLNITSGGGYSDLSVEYTPTYASVRDYTLTISDCSRPNIATIAGNRVTTNDTAQVGDTITVKATLNSNSAISDTITLTVINPLDLATLITADNVDLVANEGNKYIDVQAYDTDGEAIENVDVSNFQFSSSDNNIVTVDADGKLTAKGHGEATIEIRRLNSTEVEATCKVYVMVPPTAITLNGVSTHITDNKVIAYSKADALKIDVATSNPNYKSCATAVTYTFEKLGANDEVVATGSSVATLTTDGINFATTGKVRVTITTNSSLNGVDTSMHEKQLSYIVNVNEGINIDSIADLVAYANQSQKITANIVKDLYLTETENFGKSTSVYNELSLTGDRVINGNGYVVSNERLPLIITDSLDNIGGAFFHFVKAQDGVPFMVQINDLKVVGCAGNTDGTYSGALSYEGTDRQVIGSEGKTIRTYRRGILVEGDTYENVVKNGCQKTYVKDFRMNNVDVSGFNVGMRLIHIVDGYMKDITVDKCFSNGVEMVQNTMTLENITIGKVGAFGVEVSSDDMQNMEATEEKDLKGSAGADYNQTARLTMKGTIKSNNYSNGADTVYFQGLATKFNNTTISQMVQGITSGTINAIVDSTAKSEDAKEPLRNRLMQQLNGCIMKNDKINFYLLLFVNKTEIPNYDKGNMKQKFVEYTSDDTTSKNSINISELLNILATNPDFDGYKGYQYLIMDLITGTALGNVGQVILINEAYDPNYVHTQG